MNKKFVSFISPVYNVNLYLDDFFSSFKNLPKDQYEIIVVNDKSPENPFSIVEKWANIVNIKYIENIENLGLGFSRNVAMQNMDSRATHFMVVDSDDKLSQNAWKNIENAANDKVYVSKYYTMFDRKSKHKKRTWFNNAFVGSGVLSSWGNLVPANKKNIYFTSRTFEDFRWMAQVTKDDNYMFFDEEIIEYRNRSSSIMNTPYNSSRRSKATVDQANELIRAYNEKLIKDEKYFKFELRNLYITYMYSSKKNRNGINFNRTFFNKKDIFICNLAILPQKIIRFWWWFELFTKRKAFK